MGRYDWDVRRRVARPERHRDEGTASLIINIGIDLRCTIRSVLRLPRETGNRRCRASTVTESYREDMSLKRSKL